tara:strand:+ start:24326 stop:25072 length:747 start_codon:yes stop_codon:yes gene_type:complete
MAEQPADPLDKLWRAGVPLSKAWLAYAQPDLKAEWTALEGKSALTALTTSVKQAGLQDKCDTSQSGASIQNLLQPAQDILQARLNVTKALQGNILEYLKDGHAFAYGFEPPRHLASVPVALPKGIWKGAFDWNSSTITYAGLSFVQVRVTTRRIRKEILNLGEAAPIPPAASRGRPSVARSIRAAANALLQAGEIDVSRSARSHHPDIRNWLLENTDDLPVAPKDIHDETIRQYFSPIFNELKKTNKQ